MGVSLITLKYTKIIKDYFIFEDGSSYDNWIEFIENFKSKQVNFDKIDEKVSEILMYTSKERIALCNKNIIADIIVINKFKTKVFEKLDIHQVNSVSCMKTIKAKDDYILKTLTSIHKKPKITGRKLIINYQWKNMRFFTTVAIYFQCFKEVSLIVHNKLWSFLKEKKNKNRFMSLFLDYNFPEIIEIKAQESIKINKKMHKNATEMLDYFLKT